MLQPPTGTTSERHHHQPAPPENGATDRPSPPAIGAASEPALLVSWRPSGKETILINNLPDEFKLQTSNFKHSKFQTFYFISRQFQLYQFKARKYPIMDALNWI
jgi:hypothetical protein